MSTVWYLEIFKSKVKIYENLGDEPGMKAMWITALFIENSNNENLAMENQLKQIWSMVHEQYLAVMFLRNSDPGCYQSLCLTWKTQWQG